MEIGSKNIEYSISVVVVYTPALMSTDSSPSYSAAFHRTIQRLRALACDTERALGEAQAWVEQLEHLEDRAILARVRAATPDKLGTAFVEQVLAAAYRALPEAPRRSATWARAALHALATTDRTNSAHHALALGLRANAARILGDLLRADRFFRLARTSLRRSHVAELDVLAEIDHLEAGFLVAIGRPADAAKRLTNAASLWQVVGDLRAQAGVLMTRACVDLQMRQPQEAVDALQSALALARREGDAELSATSRNLLAEALIAADRLDEAFSLLEQAPRVPDDPIDRANRLALLGRLALASDGAPSRPDAERLLHEAREAIEPPDSNAPYELSLVWSDLAILYALEHRREQLSIALPRALAALQSTMRPASALDLVSLLGRFVHHADPHPVFDPLLSSIWNLMFSKPTPPG